MPKYELRKGEDIEKALRRFKMQIRREGLMDEIKKREFYEKPSQRRRKEKEVAVRREVKRRREAE
jgi:small subunit ribosomal protein S21